MAYKSAIESACGLALLALLLAASAAGDDSSSSAWDYGDLHGPPEWPGLCHDGKLQSPVNLQVPSPLPTQGVMAQLNWSSTARVRVETSAIGARKVGNTNPATMFQERANSQTFLKQTASVAPSPPCNDSIKKGNNF